MTMTINGSGSITGLSAGGLPDASITAADLASGAARSNFGAGAILQVVFAEYTGTQSISSTNAFNTTNITASITPASASNKILILARVSFSSSGQNVGVGFSINRNSTTLNNASGGSSANATSQSMNAYRVSQAYDVLVVPVEYVDSPATTSSTTYTVAVRAPTDASNTLINTSQNGYSHGTSSIILMEIAG